VVVIIHLHNDDSCGYQYEVDDWVKLNRNIMCNGVVDLGDGNNIHVSKGVYGKVSDVHFGSTCSWRTRQIRVELWNEEFKDFIGVLVEPVWYFNPLHEPFVVRVIEP